ncbi:MAG: TonB family protein [Bacteroidales bacterium]|nr:TonB family protein [Bacteroidales bacterium]MCM1147439.1 TonB family protein [Bacteroidales bacterium]MCM1206108.1 TonB family protein [Bacillota bacterium]MCM1510061.1 TonB family protein [Clostridium sp.]
MIERKTYRADIDRLRPRIFVLAFVATIGIFFLVLQWRSLNITSGIFDDISDDVSVDMELLASLKPEENVIAAKVHEKPVTTDRINKVEETAAQKELEELREQVKFISSAEDDATRLKDSEAEPVAPAEASVDGKDNPLRIIEQLPEFPGGMSIFMTWLTNELRYPQSCRQAKQQGTVSVTFVVEKDGSITNIKLAVPTHTPLDNEALRVIKAMPKWKAGENKGKPVRTVVAIPIVFAL